MKLFNRSRPERLVWIRETRNGIETYINPNIINIDDSIKAQIKTFLENIIRRLK